MIRWLEDFSEFSVHIQSLSAYPVLVRCTFGMVSLLFLVCQPCTARVVKAFHVITLESWQLTERLLDPLTNTGWLRMMISTIRCGLIYQQSRSWVPQLWDKGKRHQSGEGVRAWWSNAGEGSLVGDLPNPKRGEEKISHHQIFGTVCLLMLSLLYLLTVCDRCPYSAIKSEVLQILG